MGVSIAAESKWENNNSLTDITLCNLVDLFDVSLDEMVCRSNKKIETIIRKDITDIIIMTISIIDVIMII